MIIHYTKGYNGNPTLTTINKGKTFPLVTNESKNKVYTMKFDTNFSRGFFDTLERGYATVDGFRAKAEKVLKMSHTATSKVECIKKLDLFSAAILSLLEEFDVRDGKTKQ